METSKSAPKFVCCSIEICFDRTYAKLGSKASPDAVFASQCAPGDAHSSKNGAFAKVLIEITYDPNDAVSVTTIWNDNAQPLSNVQGVAWTLRQGNIISPVLVTNYLLPGATAVFTTTHLGEGGPGPPLIQAAAQGELAP
jgi:hypothetical protein